MNIPRHIIVRASVPIVTFVTLLLTIWTKPYNTTFSADGHDGVDGSRPSGILHREDLVLDAATAAVGTVGVGIKNVPRDEGPMDSVKDGVDRSRPSGILHREDLVLDAATAQTVYHNGKHLTLPLNLMQTEDYILTDFLLTRFKESIDHNGTAAETIDLYDRYLNDQPLDCRYQGRFGHVRDGGYDVCLVDPYKPRTECLVYSFGIRDDFSFDDAMASDFQCNVQCFDPRQPNYTHRRSSRVMFYNLALGSSNQRESQLYPCIPMSNAQYRTLGTILKESDHDKKIIDILKIDIEGCEWNVFPTILRENVLPRVKQLLIEVHAASEPTLINYQMTHSMFKRLDDLGFKKFHTSWTTYGGLHRSTITHKVRARAHDLGYLNVNFLDPNYRLECLPELNLTSSDTKQDFNQWYM